MLVMAMPLTTLQNQLCSLLAVTDWSQLRRDRGENFWFEWKEAQRHFAGKDASRYASHALSSRTPFF